VLILKVIVKSGTLRSYLPCNTSLVVLNKVRKGVCVCVCVCVCVFEL